MNEKAIVHCNIFIHILNHTRALVIIILNERECDGNNMKKGPPRPLYHQLVNVDRDKSPIVVNSPRTPDSTVTWSSPLPAVRAGDTVQEPPGVKEKACLRPLQ